MSSSDDLLHRVRSRLLPTAKYLPEDRGPARLRSLAQRGRIAAIERLIRTDPQSALTQLEAKLTADAPASLVRSAALAAWANRDFARAAELLERLDSMGEANLADAVKWAKAGRRIESPQIEARGRAAVMARVPPTTTSLEKSVTVLKDLTMEDLPTVQVWRGRITDEEPTVDVASLDRLLMDIRVGDVLVTDPLDPALVAAVLAEDGGPTALVRGLLRARRFDDLEELAGGFDERTCDLVGAAMWRHVAARAASCGWTSLAAFGAQRADDAMTPQRRAQIVADAADEKALLATAWEPPVRATPPENDDLDPRSVVSVLGQSLPLRSGGYATRSHGILTGLAEQGWHMNAVTRLGFPFDLWWKADDERTPAPVDVVDGIPYHRLLTEGVRHYPRAPLPPYVAEGARGIADLARSKRASLIHASSLYDVGMAGLSAARQLGVPFVYEMRGLKQLLEDARQPVFSESPRHDYLDLLEGTVAREADALLVITAALGQEMVRLGVDPDRITVVPNGVDASRFTPRGRNDELARRLGLTGKTVIGYVGGLVHYEGLELLFEAAAQLRERRADFHVLIVGDGAHERALRAVVESLGIGDLVTFTGRIPHEDVEDYLSLVDITPFPRKPLKVCELISPIKPFEAMAMRKTVVASDVAALAEIVEDGVTGRLFTKGDSSDLARVLEDLLDDPQERARLGETAREWVVAERDWRRITSVVDGVYRSLLGPSTSS